MNSETGHPPSLVGKDATVLVGRAEIQRLRDFHASHFPNQRTPDVRSGEAGTQEDHSTEHEEPEELGYYEDGVRRTLTDEQVRMFRHSEIQRLLLIRRQQREKEQQAAEQERRRHIQDADRKRRFDDEAVQQQHNVETLTYDDAAPRRSSHSTSVEKKFIWPKLGGQ